MMNHSHSLFSAVTVDDPYLRRGPQQQKGIEEDIDTNYIKANRRYLSAHYTYHI